MGRINRRSYLIANLAMLIIVFLFNNFTNFNAPLREQQFNPLSSTFLLLCFAVVTFFARRRLHDLGKSGWWILFIFIPVLNALFNLCLLLAPGQKGSNKYGPVPKPGISF